MIKPSTLHHIAHNLSQHAIIVRPSAEHICQWLYDSTGVWSRQEQAALCGVSVRMIFYMLHAYADELPPRAWSGRVYAWHPHGEKTLTEWVIWKGNSRLTRECVYWRVSVGKWSLEDALNTPVQRRRKRKM